jgi:cysteine desulfurase / selenocysteine lyase
VAERMTAERAFDLEAIRKDFPILDRQVHGRRLVYLDSGASSLPPVQVTEAMTTYYETTHANVHRGVYVTAEEATHRYEQARMAIGRFIGAPDPAHEIVFTKNCTEAFNLLAHSWGRTNLASGDVVVLTEMEHHANIVPWLMLAEERGIELRYLPITDEGLLDLTDLDRILEGAKLLSVTAMSNVLGTINPLAFLAAAAHRHGALIAVDGAQSVPHLATSVRDLDIDMLCFSAHKMLGPTGIGVLWARAELLEAMPPFLGGGGMILDVRLDRFTPAAPPDRFEAGTPPIAEAVGLTAAVTYLESLSMDAIRAHELALTNYAFDALATLGDDLVIFGPGPSPERGGVLSISFGDVHAHDLAQVLDQFGVCVRPGHHCAKPLMRRLGVNATARASFGCYSGTDDVDVLVEALGEARRIFA